MKIKCLLVVTLLSLPCLPMDQKVSSEERSPAPWQVLSEFDAQGRLIFLKNNIGKAITKENLEPYYEHFFSVDAQMGVFGFSFTYLGQIENVFLNYLRTIDLPSSTIVFPACGNGRTVIDALALTDGIRIIANDLNEQALVTLEKAAGYFFDTKKSRISYQAGEMIEMLKRLPKNSVDAVFSANVIHFLSPTDLGIFMDNIHRVLKPKGRLFLQWEGYSPSFSYEGTSPEVTELEPILRKRFEKKKEKNPGFLDEEAGKKLGFVKIFNYISLEGMENKLRTNFQKISGRYYILISLSGCRDPKAKQGWFRASYSEKDITGPLKSFPSIDLILEKRPTNNLTSI